MQNVNHFENSVEERKYRNELLGMVSNYFTDKTKDDDEYDKMIDEMDRLKSSLRDLKENISDKIKSSDIEVVQKGVDLYEKTIKNIGSKTMVAIRKWDPEFDLLEFEVEAQYIFEEIYSKYLQHDLDYIEGVCSSEALGYFKSMITVQQMENSIPKFQKIVFVKSFSLSTATIHHESGIPLFQFNLEFAEINCLVNKDDPEEIINGYENNLEYTKFMFVLCPWDNADVGKFFYKYFFANKRNLWSLLGYDICSGD